MSDILGKIDHQLVTELIAGKCGRLRSEVSTGPAFGVDVSVVELPGNIGLALTSDPLSLIPSLGLEESAWLSVHLMTNDMATTGFVPMYGQFVLNLPATLSRDDFKTYWDHIHRFCKEIGVAITGGHTGFIEGQNSTLAGGGTFITAAPTNKILCSHKAQAGDILLVTKSSAISSAAILAMSFPETVKNKAGIEVYQQACASFYETSSLPDALAAAGESHEHEDISAMHDVTEGGVLGALYEMAVASGNGLRIYADQIPTGTVQASICSIFNLEPARCIGAGSMIIACRKDAAADVINRLAQKNIACTQVGELCAAREGMTLIKDATETRLHYQAEDPYWAAFFNAYNAGWK